MAQISNTGKINVPLELSEDQVQFFIEKGYVAVPNLLETEEIEEA